MAGPSGEMCINCRWYEVTECRRHPPVIDANPYNLNRQWPQVMPQDWCGEFARRADKSCGLDVYSRPECIFNYCPHPDSCKTSCTSPAKPESVDE